MCKKAILLSGIVLMFCGLWSMDLDWGLKYGMGSAWPVGSNATYELDYQVSRVSSGITTDLGYLRLSSTEHKSDFASDLGVFGSILLSHKKDSVHLQTELLWQRFSYTDQFSGSPLNTDNLLLATVFADTLKGEISRTQDYLSIPLMLRLQQGLDPDLLAEHYLGAFIYAGPALSILVNSSSVKRKGIKALDQDVAEFVQNSQNDSDLTQYYTSQYHNSGVDKVQSFKYDFVMGFGFGLKDLFNLGVTKDSFIFDCRFTTGINAIGNAESRTDIKLRSVIVSIGAKL